MDVEWKKKIYYLYIVFIFLYKKKYIYLKKLVCNILFLFIHYSYYALLLKYVYQSVLLVKLLTTY